MTDPIRRAWVTAAPRLAAFTFAHLPNRVDVWGGYVHPDHRAQWGKTLTLPAKKRRGVVQLTPAALARHFAAQHGGDVIGLHTTSPVDTSRWFGLDFDVHDEGASDTPAHRAVVQAAFAWCVQQLRRDCQLVLEDSNGNGGRHLWVRFDTPVSTPSLHAFLLRLLDACHAATTHRPEAYPKQARLVFNNKGKKQVGNWLRLPGLHHTRPHWSRLGVPGGKWQSGAAAVDIWLQWPATPAAVIPPLQEPEVPPAPKAMGLPLSAAGVRNRAAAIARYVAKLPHGVAGTGRSNHLYRLACFLMYDMECRSDEALPVLHAWNSGNTPPLTEAKVVETWENAAAYGGRHAA